MYALSDGYEFEPESQQLQNRLYLNDDNSNLVMADKNTLPVMIISGSMVYHADFDTDGYMDFIIEITNLITNTKLLKMQLSILSQITLIRMEI